MSPSLNPQTFIEGGLIDDFDGKVLDARFCLYDYDGNVPGGALSLGMSVEYTDDQGAKKTMDQYWSAGDKKYFTPNEDGSELVAVGDKQALNMNTNAAKLLESLVKAGFPVAQLESGKITCLIGLEAHFNRVAQPKRQGLSRLNSKNPDREPSVLLISKVIKMPGGAAGPKPLGGVKNQAAAAPAAQAQPAAAAPAATVAVDGDVESATMDTLIGILAEAGGSLAKKDLPTKAFKATTGNKLQAKICQRIHQDSFLSNVTGVTYDGATVTLG